MKGFEFAKQFDTIEEKMIVLFWTQPRPLTIWLVWISIVCPSRRKWTSFTR